MKPIYILAPGRWAHHSWVGRGRPIRGERAVSAAGALLLARFPELAAGLPPGLAPVFLMPRPAFARLCRTAAALAHPDSLRKVVSIPSRRLLQRELGAGRLRAIQRSRRRNAFRPGVVPEPDWTSRAETTSMGLLLSMQALPDPRQRVWLQLRLPASLSDAASANASAALSQEAAAELIDEAHRVMRGAPC